MLRDPSINMMTRDVAGLSQFYQRLGFRLTFRTPKAGTPVHVEVALGGFTIGISSVEAAISDHGLKPNLGGRPIAVVLWSDDADRDYALLLTKGATPLRPPRDFRAEGTTVLRTAWVEDPDGNPINLVQREAKQRLRREGSFES